MFLRLALLTLMGFSSATQANDGYFMECYGKAVAAAKAIDSLNFRNLSQQSVVIDAVSQKMRSAEINVSFDDSRNRNYTIRITKNRGASLRGQTLTENVGCYIESVN